jgi:hypothetical protein
MTCTSAATPCAFADPTGDDCTHDQREIISASVHDRIALSTQGVEP